MRILQIRDENVPQVMKGSDYYRMTKRKQFFFFTFLLAFSLWNNSLIRISVLRGYWLETMRDGHKHLLNYLDKCMGVYLNPLLHA